MLGSSCWSFRTATSLAFASGSARAFAFAAGDLCAAGLTTGFAAEGAAFGDAPVRAVAVAGPVALPRPPAARHDVLVVTNPIEGS